MSFETDNDVITQAEQTEGIDEVHWLYDDIIRDLKSHLRPSTCFYPHSGVWMKSSVYAKLLWRDFDTIACQHEKEGLIVSHI